MLTGNGTAYMLTCDTVLLSKDNYSEFGGIKVSGLAGIETN